MIIVDKHNCQEIIINYIKENNIKIINYIESIPDLYFNMLKSNHTFVIDRDLLKSILVDICYIMSPNDDFNKSLVLEYSLSFDDDDDDDSNNDDHDSENGNYNKDNIIDNSDDSDDDSEDSDDSE